MPNKTGYIAEILDPSNWESEEQYCEGHPLGYAEVTYIGEFVHIEAAQEFRDILEQLAEARKLLIPFAACADEIYPESPDRLTFWASDQVTGEPLNLGQLRAAAKWLKENPAT